MAGWESVDLRRRLIAAWLGSLMVEFTITTGLDTRRSAADDRSAACIGDDSGNVRRNAIAVWITSRTATSGILATLPGGLFEDGIGRDRKSIQQWLEFQRGE